MPPRPITDEDRRRVRDLHAAGLNRNQIAKELGRSGATVSKIAGDLGLSFDRVKVKAATEAKVIDAKARRVALVGNLLEDAERLRAQLFAEATLHSFGGADHTYRAVTVERPPAREQREIMQAAATAITTSLRLDLHDANTGNEQVGSLLGNLFASLRDKHNPETSADDG